jgi:ketosteroid isomerase-like protein
MKRSLLVVLTVMFVFAGSALAQAPERGQGGQGRGGGGGRGGRGGGLPPAPTLTGPVADMVNMIVTAINAQDAAYLQKVVAPDAIWADEDGHFLPAGIWVNRLMTAKPAKKMGMTNLTGQTWDNGAWAAFRYTLDETTQAGAANQMKGTATLAFKKVGNDWQVAMIHAPVDGPAIAPH